AGPAGCGPDRAARDPRRRTGGADRQAYAVGRGGEPRLALQPVRRPCLRQAARRPHGHRTAVREGPGGALMTTTRRQTTLGGVAGALSALHGGAASAQTTGQGARSVPAELILTKGRFTTLDRSNPNPQAVAIGEGRFVGVGSEAEMRALA